MWCIGLTIDWKDTSWEESPPLVTDIEQVREILAHRSLGVLPRYIHKISQ